MTAAPMIFRSFAVLSESSGDFVTCFAACVTTFSAGLCFGFAAAVSRLAGRFAPEPSLSLRIRRISPMGQS